MTGIKALYVKHLIVGAVAKSQPMDASGLVPAYFGPAGVIVEIVKRLKTDFGKKTTPRTCKNNSFHL
jgi:hypothetical protein